MTNENCVFLYGTLCDPELFEIVSGERYSPYSATLAEHRVCWAAGLDFPLLAADLSSTAKGAVVRVTAEARERMDFYEVGFGYTVHDHVVETNAGPVTAAVYHPPQGRWDEGEPWSLADWQRIHGALVREAAGEYMRLFPQLPPEIAAESFAQVRSRAASRLRAAAEPPGHALEPVMSVQDVEILKSTQPYTNYFAVREDDLRFPTFTGTQSEIVRRAAFMGGDAVTVLPYDPETDKIQLVRQFRYGAFVRSDPDPWTLEPIAGRIDAGEAPEDAARREAFEEAGLTVTDLHRISAYYPSPAAYSEFLFSYVAIVDLSGMEGTVSGLDSEAEDILSHVIPFDDALSMIESGEIDTGPLVISLLWLAANRERFRQE